MSKKNNQTFPPNEIIFYETEDGKISIAVRFEAEIIGAHASKPNMGLTTWRRAPDGKIFVSDVRIAKNYLSKDEISQLNRIVNMYIDYAEFQAARGKVMLDWVDNVVTSHS